MGCVNGFASYQLQGAVDVVSGNFIGDKTVKLIQNLYS